MTDRNNPQSFEKSYVTPSGDAGARGNTGSTAQDAMSSAQGKADQAMNKAQDISQQAQSKATAAKDKAEQAGQQAQAKADEGMDKAAQGASQAADMLRQRGQQSGGTVGAAATTAADTLDSASSYLRSKDTEDLLQDLEALIRRKPVESLLVAAGAGFLLSKIFS